MMDMQIEKLLIELAIIAVEKAYLTEANDIYCWLKQLDKKYLESALLIKILILLRQEQYQTILELAQHHQQLDLMPFFILSAHQLGLAKQESDFFTKLTINKNEHADLINLTTSLIEITKNN
ncbi:YscG family type III secretion protein [Arsenophonus nasoniae]|uniref:YscG family type III secretion protein n=1 Tax=Arsenophonus nasoniae TaxID=638 RepID=A0AA95GCG3_9GAMM|nr:YscG family type III secretion protein [Arsenophonus nasoniae]WGL94419.1 YscG family type III secretion protein [Arsenophonus nasoniae]